MRRPRLSVRTAMLVVLVLAVDLAALRALFQPFSLDNVVFGLTTIPTAGILLVAFGVAVFQLRAHREVHPSLVGLLLGGSLGFIIMAVVVSDTQRGVEFYERTLVPLQYFVGVKTLSHPGLEVFDIGLIGLTLAAPQGILAAIGAIASSRLGIAIVMHNRHAPIASLSGIEPGAV